MTFATLLLALLATPGANQAPRPIILDFHASWCGPCREMRPNIQLLTKNGYPVRSIDIDKSPDLAEKYQVEAVPTFVVVDPQGRELNRTQGFQPAANLASLYKKARAKLDVQDAPSELEPQPDPAEAIAAEPEASTDRQDPSGKNPRPWETVVRIRVHNPPKFVGFGSGTIISSTEEESIILTCAHIFHIDGARNQPTPSRFPRRITVDLFDGQITGTNPAQVHPIGTVEGQVIDYDFTTDVGLIRIRPGKRLPASPVAPPTWRPQKGLPMITVGCSQGNDATAWSTRITSVGSTSIDGRSYQAIECQHAPKVGRSGGGLYTEDGYLVGVCDFADPQNNRGLYAHPRSIQRLLDRNRLTALYDPRVARPGPMLASNRGAAVRQAPEPSKLRAQSADAREISMPEPEMLGIRLKADAPPLADEQVGSSRRIAWQSPSDAPAAGQSRARTSPRTQSRKPLAVESEDIPEALATDLRMTPSAASDPLGQALGVDDDLSMAPAPSRPKVSNSADAWRPAQVSTAGRRARIDVD